MYTEEEARKECLEYFGGEELPANIVKSKYLLQNSEGFLEKSPDEVIRRVAGELARIEQKYPNPVSFDDIYARMKGFCQLLAQGSPMAAIGNKMQVMSVSNCFTLPGVIDSYGGIFNADECIAQLSKRRGGVGFDVSNLRPALADVKNAAKTSSGMIAFVKRFSATLREIGQGGRRAAGMQSCSVHHPDIIEFIRCKLDTTAVTGCNISVRFSDVFMQAVEDDTEYLQYWPMEGPRKIEQSVRARDIWKEFIDCAWQSAEPGALFWDTIQRMTPSEAYDFFKAVGVNPCAEAILSGDENCRLFITNACAFVRNPYQNGAHFDWEEYTKAVHLSQRLMDDIVDLDIESTVAILSKVKSDPESDRIKRTEVELWERILDKAVRGRRTGNGMTAIGDTLAMLGISYSGAKGIAFVEKLYAVHSRTCWESSIELASERGAFPDFERVTDRSNDFTASRLAMISNDHFRMYHKTGRRNIAATMQAPTGSTSCIAAILDKFGVTSGPEPLFKRAYSRRRKLDTDSIEEVHYTDATGDQWHTFEVLHSGEALWRERNPEADPTDSPYEGSTADCIDWLKSVELQAAAQSHVDHAISKTCNLPSEATRELVSECYMKAWKSGCKGFTIYREGSRDAVLFTEEKPLDRSTKKRPKTLDVEIFITQVQGVKHNVVVGMHEGKPYEVFCLSLDTPLPAQLGTVTRKSSKVYELATTKGYTPLPTEGETAKITRLISLSLRHGVDVRFIVEQLQKDSNFSGLPKGIARVLKKYIEDGTTSSKACPECDGNLAYQEGCMTCTGCGWSKCG